MTKEIEIQNTGVENGKYQKCHWEDFLKESHERIEKQKRFVNREGEFDGVDENVMISKTPYRDYDNQVINFMRTYEKEHRKALSDAYLLYEESKSERFFENWFQFMDESKMKRNFKRCKILIVTANPIEKAMLHSCICQKNPQQKIIRFICDSNVYYVFKWNQYWVTHVHQHHTGANKDLGMNATINEALKHIKPNVIFSLGVAYGIDYKTQNIGDVLVSRQIFPYAENKRDGEVIKPDRWQDKAIDNWLDVRLSNANGFIDEITYGGVLSGGSVMSSSTEKDKVCTAYVENDFVIGGEMEGSGLFQTAHFTDIPCAVIKGICDWGVAKNDIFGKEKLGNGKLKEEWFKDSLQAYAMSLVVEKCEPLFRDRTLFNSTKNKKAENEKKKSNILFLSNLISIICMLAITIGVLTCVGQREINFLLLVLLLLVTSVICISLMLVAIFKKNKY